LPIYEYRCKKCGQVVEKIQKFSDPLLKTHEDCGGPLDLLLSPPALQFKGSGFYITDYARKSAPAESSSSSSDSASKSTSSGSKGGASESSASKTSGASKKSDS